MHDVPNLGDPAHRYIHEQQVARINLGLKAFQALVRRNLQGRTHSHTLNQFLVRYRSAVYPPRHLA